MTIFNWNYFNAESANKKSDITAGFLILQTPHKYLLLCSLLTFCCLQSVKDTKFESNSQLSPMPLFNAMSCLQSVKDTKFESNSQLPCQLGIPSHRCLQSVKDTKFESNSQLCLFHYFLIKAVCSPSKIQSLKAIHNWPEVYFNILPAVCSPSKIQSLKAIHNPALRGHVQAHAVCSPSKIQSLKAIHNKHRPFSIHV